MNITIDVRSLMQKKYSGIANYTYNLLENLFAIDQQNQYKLFYNSHKNVTACLPFFHNHNIKFFGFKYPNKLFNLSQKILNYPKIDKLIPDTEIFFIPNFNFLSLSTRCQKTITVHDLSFERYPHFYSLKRRFWHKFINPKKLISGCDKVIAISESTKNDLIELYKVPGNKIKVIYSGIDHHTFKKLEPNQPKLKQVKEKYQLPNQFLLFLGTLEPRKNVESIIETFNLFKSKHTNFENLNLVIVGQPGWNFKKIFALADKSPYKAQIKFIGYADHQDLPSLYNLAEIFLFPSFYEGFGLPVLEAQACGVPVIAGLNSSLPEILQDSAFLINPDNLSELTEVIYQILTNEEIKRNLIDKGFKNAQRFSWQKCAQETLTYLLS